MTKLHGLLGASLVGLATMIAAPAVQADVDISFGMYAPSGDDGRLFYSISSRYFGHEQREITNWARRYPNPDDLAVFLYICSKSSETPEGIDFYRRKGSSWYDVGVRAGVPLDAWYVTVSAPPRGGRYARPYDRWDRHRRDPRQVVRLNDREIRDLVAVRMAHEYYGVSPEIAMTWRQGGASVRTIMTREYRSRHRGGPRDGNRRDGDRRDGDRRDGRRNNRND